MAFLSARTIDRTHYQRSAKLYKQLIHRDRKKVQPPARSRWADQFRRLQTVDGVSPGRIDKVLNWYCRNADAPWVSSAQSFRKRFAQLEKLMQDQGEDHGLDLCPCCERALEDLRELSWGNKMRRALPRLLYHSHRWSTTVLNALHELSKEPGPTGLYFQYLADHFPRGYEFLMWYWGEQVHRIVSYRKTIPDPDNYLPRTDNSHIDSLLESFCNECGSPTQWSRRLKERLDAGIEAERNRHANHSHGSDY